MNNRDWNGGFEVHAHNAWYGSSTRDPARTLDGASEHVLRALAGEAMLTDESRDVVIAAVDRFADSDDGDLELDVTPFIVWVRRTLKF